MDLAFVVVLRTLQSLHGIVEVVLLCTVIFVAVSDVLEVFSKYIKSSILLPNSNYILLPFPIFLSFLCDIFCAGNRFGSVCRMTYKSFCDGVTWSYFAFACYFD